MAVEFKALRVQKASNRYLKKRSYVFGENMHKIDWDNLCKK